MDHIDDYITEALPDFKGQLARLVAIPSISSEASHREDLMRVVEAMADIVRGYGFQTSIVQVGNHPPALVARLEVDPHAPWVAVYNHLDVQPANEKDSDGNPRWKTDPFAPFITDTDIMGRGATDDKGPALTIVHGAHFRHQAKMLKTNVELIYETGEESGSPGFGQILGQALADGLLVPPDSILISDTTFEGDNPAITYALRGLVTATLRIDTADEVVHSGLGGGFAVNPLIVMAGAIDSFVNPKTGHVRVDEFYRGVPALSSAEREQLVRVAGVVDAEKLKRDLKAREVYSADPFSVLMHTWCAPTFEVHDIRGGVAGTKIPPYAEADVSMRLVGSQDPDRIGELLASHMKAYDPRINVTIRDKIGAVEFPYNNHFTVKAAEACRAGFGKEPLYVRSGGSIGATLALKQRFPGVQQVMIAQSLVSDGYHAPNEKFEWAQAIAGMKTMSAYLGNIGGLRTR